MAGRIRQHWRYHRRLLFLRFGCAGVQDRVQHLHRVRLLGNGRHCAVWFLMHQHKPEARQDAYGLEFDGAAEG